VQDGSRMHARDSGSGADGTSLDQVLQDANGLFFGQDHHAKWPVVRLRECLFAVQAAVTLQTVAVLTELFRLLITASTVHRLASSQQRMNDTYGKHFHAESSPSD